MKELEFISIIKESLSKSSHIGDDCAYLKELEIVVTQDSMVEDIHFSRKFATPYEIGYKSIMINLSDVYAAGGVPKYLTISLSLPKDIDNDFVKEFYRACDELSVEYGFEIVGGDITGSEKIFVSVCAIGTTRGRNISSRNNAKIGDYVITTGVHGSSEAGLWLLNNGITTHPNIVEKHLKPMAQNIFSQEISTQIKTQYSMMDTSDGLMDAVFKMAEASKVTIKLDFDKIPYDKEIEQIAKLADINFKDWIFWGGEDFQIVACVNKNELMKLDTKLYTVIGKVQEYKENYFVEIMYPSPELRSPSPASGEGKSIIVKITNLEKTFNHFKEI